jgi:hypothetical protein
VDVTVTRTARWMIGRRGGELWVWAAPLGGEAIIRTSTSGRNDRTFDPVRLDGVVVWFEQGMAVEDVTIGLDAAHRVRRGRALDTQIGRPVRRWLDRCIEQREPLAEVGLDR